MQRCRNPCNLLCIRNITKTVQNCELSAGKSLTRSTHSFERLEMQILYRGIAPSCHVEGLRWCGLTFLKIHRSSISSHNPLILSGFHYKNTLFRPNFQEKLHFSDRTLCFLATQYQLYCYVIEQKNEGVSKVKKMINMTIYRRV